MDLKRLRNDLIDYYGSAMFSGFPMAMMDLADIERMTEVKLVKTAKELGFDMSKYED
jgi:hypothetical protein